MLRCQLGSDERWEKEKRKPPGVERMDERGKQTGRKMGFSFHFIPCPNNLVTFFHRQIHSLMYWLIQPLTDHIFIHYLIHPSIRSLINEASFHGFIFYSLISVETSAVISLWHFVFINAFKQINWEVWKFDIKNPNRNQKYLKVIKQTYFHVRCSFVFCKLVWPTNKTKTKSHWINHFPSYIN